MQLFGLVQAKDATTHALKRSLSEDQGGIGLPHPTLILPQQPRYKGVASPPVAPLVLLVAAAGALLVSAHLARLAKLSSRVGARHARAGVRVVGNPVWSDHSHPRSLIGPTLFSWARRNFSIVEHLSMWLVLLFHRWGIVAGTGRFDYIVAAFRIGPCIKRQAMNRERIWITHWKG